MPRLPRAPQQALLLPAALALTLGLSACGGDGNEAAEAPTSPATTSATAPPSPPASSPTEDDGADEPEPSRTARPNRTLAPLPPQPLLAKPARTHLLDAGRMPTVADDLPWTDAAKGDGSRPVGACQKASLFDIGAVRTTERRFATADGSTTAVQVLGRFADRLSAYRAAEVLMAWRADCAERLSARRAKVGEARDVPVRTGFGTVYAATYGERSADGARATALGVVRKGSWVSVVEVATDERRWPRGRNPARQAVRRIAATFRAS